MHMRGYVPILRLHTRFRHLPQREMLGETNLTINTYFFHLKKLFVDLSTSLCITT